MKKFILTIIITGLFLFSGQNIMAENQAGNSAELALSVKIDKETRTSLETKKKEMVIRSVLKRYNSPMADASESFVESCLKYNLDCYLLPSIAGLESTFGRFIWPNSYNPFGWARGYMMFNDWSQAIDTVGRGLRENYMNKWGLLSVYDIGPTYSESPTWSARVAWFMDQFKEEEEKISLQSIDFPVKL